VLVVCTGNICRSPMAEALLRAHLAAHGVAANVHSAGTMAWSAAPPSEAVVVMEERGVDLSTHRSRQLDIALVEAADLVLGMTRQHVGRVEALVPDASHRTFLVGELVRLGRQVGARSAEESVGDWLLRIAAVRPDGRIRGRGVDEVTDPLGEPLSTYQATAARLDAELRELAGLLAGEEA
jgi:protein-tyrosine phosphatase